MNRTDILKLTNEVFDRLEGDWLLVGGALLHVLDLSDRRTLDIDLVPMQKVSNEDQLKEARGTETDKLDIEIFERGVKD